MSAVGSTVSVASLPEPAGGTDGRYPPMADEVARIVATVEEHRPTGSRERSARATILDELARLEHPFDRTADITHVTASGIVAGARGVVLLRHLRLDRWLQPGGHLDPGEGPVEAVLRECAEETGLPVRHPAAGPRLIHLDVHRGASGHRHLDLCYLVATSPERDPDPPPGESQQVAWFSWEEAATLADGGLAGALAAARRLAGAEPGPAPGPEEERR